MRLSKRLALVASVVLLFGALTACETTTMAGDDMEIHGSDMAVGPLAPCLDRPGELPRPPAGALPCELFPPSYP